jgi:hypothetical protein
MTTGRNTMTTGVLFMNAESGITMIARMTNARLMDLPAHNSKRCAIQSIAPQAP